MLKNIHGSEATSIVLTGVFHVPSTAFRPLSIPIAVAREAHLEFSSDQYGGLAAFLLKPHIRMASPYQIFHTYGSNPVVLL